MLEEKKIKIIKKIILSIKPSWCEDIVLSFDKLNEKEYYLDITYLVEEDSPALLKRNEAETFWKIGSTNEKIKNRVSDFLGIYLIINQIGLTTKNFFYKNQSKINESDEKKDGLGVLIDEFNNDKFSRVLDLFGDAKKFFEFVIKKGREDEIDSEKFPNLLPYIQKQENPNIIYELALENLSDIIKEGDEYYLIVDSLSDFASCFRYYKDDLSESTVESILSGEYDDYYYDTTDNVFEDVVLNLDDENLNYIKNILKEELIKIGKIEINYSVSDLLSRIGDEIAVDGEIILTPELIDELLDDNETFDYLLQNKTDLFGDLYNLHSSCHNSLIHDELFNKILKELVGEVVDDISITDYEYSFQSRGETLSRTMYKLKITKCLFDTVDTFLTNYKYYSDNLEDVGSYLELWKMLADYVSYRKYLRLPNSDIYPYSKDLKKCMNDNFDNYF